jgi:hypothetical protein
MMGSAAIYFAARLARKRQRDDQHDATLGRDLDGKSSSTAARACGMRRA